MDKGTENVLIGTVQYALREDGTDMYSGTNSVRYGSSPANIVRFNQACSKVFLGTTILAFAAD